MELRFETTLDGPGIVGARLTSATSPYEAEGSPMHVAALVEQALGGHLPVAITAYDGSHAGPADATATIVVRSPDALARVAWRPGELGLARAYVAGDVDVEGDLFEALDFLDGIASQALHPAALAAMARAAGPAMLHCPAPPPEEVRLRGRRHSQSRDAASISHHYDVSNDFYRLVLGPSMTYSCAVFSRADQSLETAQEAKHELVSTKLALEPGSRLLDVGCGWGSMVMHAAHRHGARAVGVSLSRQQVDAAAKRVADDGLAEQVEVRLQDYREVTDGPFDAISSVGMFEHVGRARFEAYARRLHGLLRPGGRLLNHAISRPGKPTGAGSLERARGAARRIGIAVGSARPSLTGSPFVERYVFPDGELHEVGTVVSMLEEYGFEVRDVESLREHYGLTLRRWVRNLENNWVDAVGLVGARRARVWRLYMAASARGFERGHLSVHQVLAAKPDDGTSGFPLRSPF